MTIPHFEQTSSGKFLWRYVGSMIIVSPSSFDCCPLGCHDPKKSSVEPTKTKALVIMFVDFLHLAPGLRLIIAIVYLTPLAR